MKKDTRGRKISKEQDPRTIYKNDIRRAYYGYTANKISKQEYDNLKAKAMIKLLQSKIQEEEVKENE